MNKKERETLRREIDRHRDAMFITCDSECWCWEKDALLNTLEEQEEQDNERCKGLRGLATLKFRHKVLAKIPVKLYIERKDEGQ